MCPQDGTLQGGVTLMGVCKVKEESLVPSSST